MSKRIEWIDIAKGILIVLVVLGHSEISGIAASVINSFHIHSKYIYQGLTISDIALLLHSSPKTIQKYLAIPEDQIPESKEIAMARFGNSR